MKWGVRKAILTGNQRALDRHYRKAAKKLAKLTDIGINSKKYAAKSVAYGAAAAGTGTLAVGGTKMAGNILSYAARKIAPIYARYAPHTKKNYELYRKLADNDYVSDKVNAFGNKTYITKKNTAFVENAAGERMTIPGTNKYMTKTTYTPVVTGDTLYRAGAGLVTAGLAAKSAQNAYRASHGAKYRAKAKAWKNEMNSAFKGTQYEGRYDRPKRRRRKR